MGRVDRELIGNGYEAKLHDLSEVRQSFVFTS